MARHLPRLVAPLTLAFASACAQDLPAPFSLDGSFSEDEKGIILWAAEEWNRAG